MRSVGRGAHGLPTPTNSGDAGQAEPGQDGAQVSECGQLHLWDVTGHFFLGKGRNETGTGRRGGGSSKEVDWEEGW